MKSKKKIINTLIIFIIFLPLLSTIEAYFSSNKIQSLKNFENQTGKKGKSVGSWDLTGSPIYIDDDHSNNWSYTASSYDWCSGSGTWNDPYIIENVTIDGQNSDCCIEIRNSNAHFIIRNCKVYNSSVGFSDAGIKLVYVNNGKLINTNCLINYRGIYLENSDYNILSGNIANYNEEGIRLSYCNNNTILENNANNNKDYGIRLYNCNNNVFSGNNASNNEDDGISLYNCNNNTFSGNNANYNERYAIMLGESDNNTFSGNNANNNKDYGIRLYNCNNNVFSGNNASNNEDDGISLYNCNNNTFSGNNANYNERYAIMLGESDNNTFSGNNANYNEEGIRLSICNNNTISGNNANYNGGYGIVLYFSDNNYIEGNNINDNSVGIYLDRSNYNYVLNNKLSGNLLDISENYCQGNVFKNNIFDEKILLPIDIVTIIAINVIIIIIIAGMIIIKKSLHRDEKEVSVGDLVKGKIVDNKVIVVKGLKKFFGDVKAVNGISFDVRQGEIFGLLGPNGAGKTTTIKLLLGFLEPDEGEMSILGLNPEYDDVQIKDRVGYVSEEHLKFKALTLKGLFNFIASIRGLDENLSTKLIKDYLESFEIIEYYDQLIASLSHGDKQKLQVIVAVLHEPDLLILDEPVAGLDPKSVKVVKSILELHTQRGGSVLFSTHIIEIAEDLFDRIGIIHKGKMVGIGTLEDLRQQADKVGASLEDIFLRLTEQDTSVNEIVKKLRASFKKKI